MSAFRILKAAALALSLSLSGCGAAGSSKAAAQSQSAQSDAAVSAIRAAAVPITGTPKDYNHLLTAIGDSRRVLLGESTHGTREYYEERARISERLIRERGVKAIAVEGDWSPTYRLNLYVRGLGTERSAAQALRGYTQFPQWMWPNESFRGFVERLRTYNLTLPPEQRVGLYGMDVYDLFEAAEAVVAYLSQVGRAAAGRARSAYRCFARHGRSTHAYGEAARNPRGSCERQAGAVVAEMARIPRPSAPAEAERHFAAVRSAASVAAAEAYFRTAYAGSMAWNVRDQRMAENVEAIAAHVEFLSGHPGKVVMWSHNTHSGDARATFAAQRGELNLGQLMRQRHGDAAFLIGFFAYGGTVMAAPEWDARGRVYAMRPALPGSYSALFHGTGMPRFSLVLRGNEALSRHLRGPMLERAIGVVYAPQTERQSHYFEAELSEQFDAAVFFDTATAVTALR